MPRRLKKQEPIIWGEIKEVKDPDGFVRKHFFPLSLGHMNAILSRFSIGKKIGIQMITDELSFSDSQRAYHFVLLGYIAHHTGNTVDDEHHDSMVEMFGIRTFTNYKGEKREGRYSISNASELTLDDISRLIERDVRVCNFLELVIPTKKELGYIDENELPYHK
jgi:hypothetical protein